MAPRGRPRKRLTRMDAAIDAMTPFGFPKQLVRKTVKGLLKVYGGDVGWPFVEQDAYKVLIDTILAEQEKEDAEEERYEEENLLPNGELRDEGPGDSSVADDPGPSAPSLPPISSEAAGAAAQTFETGAGLLLTAEGDREGGDSSGEGMQLDVVSKGCDGFRDYNPALKSPPSLIPTTPRVTGLPRRRRKPCYGWISDESGDEEDDFIELTPAPRLKPELENRVGGAEKRRKMTSRWDV